MSIGERLKEERQRLGQNQTELASLAGTTKKSQIEYEKGSTFPNANYLAAIASAGADVRYIVTGERDGPPPLRPDEQLLLDRYRISPLPLRDAALRVLLGGEVPSSAVRNIKVSGGSGHQVAGGKIINRGGGK